MPNRGPFWPAPPPWWARAPLWQYFSRLQKKADESIAAPKGRGSPDPRPFSLQTGRFLATTMGAMMGIADPSGRTLRGQPAVVGEAMPPLWQYFSCLLRQTSPVLPPKRE
jgi:hypothetical protein